MESIVRPSGTATPCLTILVGRGLTVATATIGKFIEQQALTDLVPVEVLTEVNTAIAVLEIQGPAITEALRQLDRATTMAWKAMHMLGVTDDEWELVKREIGIERGWDAAYQLVSSLDLPTMQPPADVTADAP